MEKLSKQVGRLTMANPDGVAGEAIRNSVRNKNLAKIAQRKANARGQQNERA